MKETVIIGAGIAGMTAAIYAARKRMDFVFISKDVGGQFLESGEVLNYPGIKETTGAEFESKMEEQLEFNDVEVKDSVEAEGIEEIEGGFKVKTNKDDFEAKAVIICTGARPRRLKVPGEKKLQNKGLTYCAICDGPLFKDKEVAIIGGGDSALEAVDFMKDIAKKIYLLNINEELNAHEYLVENINKIDKLEVINEAETTKVLGDKSVEGIKYKKDGEEKKLEVKGLIVEIGRVPNTDFVEDFLELDEHRHIKIDCQGRTSKKGIFAAGDCASGHEYQYCIAAGQGCMALLKAARYLAGKKD